jgi:hypothetical protein
MGYRVVAAVMISAAFTIVGAGELRSQAADSLSPLFPGVWVRGETEGPLFCFVFAPGGGAEFRARRVTDASYRWSYDSTSGYLALTFPRLPRGVVNLLRGAVGYELVSYDTLTRTAVQYVRDRQMWYTGYTLFPAFTLDSAYYALARRICRLPSTTPPSHRGTRQQLPASRPDSGRAHN